MSYNRHEDDGFRGEDRCSWCGSRDTCYWSSNEGSLCVRCSREYREEKEKRRSARIAAQMPQPEKETQT